MNIDSFLESVSKFFICDKAYMIPMQFISDLSIACNILNVNCPEPKIFLDKENRVNLCWDYEDEQMLLIFLNDSDEIVFINSLKDFELPPTKTVLNYKYALKNIFIFLYDRDGEE